MPDNLLGELLTRPPESLYSKRGCLNESITWNTLVLSPVEEVLALV
jgi:hypothetical protein